MKKISIFLFAAAALIWGAGCEESSDTDKGITVSAIALDSSLSGGITLVVGETTNIAGKVSVLPEEAAGLPESYHSSDASIVTVDANGEVEAVSPGLAMITITVGGKNAHFEVKVEAQKVPVESVTLPEEWADGVTLKAGETMDIANKASYTPSDATHTDESYASSNEEVATVSAEGLVTALKPGETEITITIDSKSASFTLTVEKVAVETVTLPDEWKEGVEIALDGTLELAGKVTIAPENATYKEESYASSNEEVATVSAEGIVTPLQVGTTTISITVDGVTASFELTVVTDVPVALESIKIKNGASDIQGVTTVVLGQNTTFDLYSQLDLAPANQNEGVKYVTYGSEEIATIDENGIVTCKGVGTVTFVILAKSNENNDFKNAGAKKAYFAVNITDPNDLDRTGWKVSSTSGTIGGTGGSDIAPFDNVFDPCVFKDVKGSNFSLTKPTTDDGEVWFVVDMQKEQTVNYFRLMHQSCRNTDRGCRWKKFSAILGSNDGQDFTLIASDVIVPNLEYDVNGIDPNDGATRAIDKYHTCSNIKFPNPVKYRFLKFVGKKDCFDTKNSSCQFAELYLGLDE